MARKSDKGTIRKSVSPQVWYFILFYLSRKIIVCHIQANRNHIPIPFSTCPGILNHPLSELHHHINAAVPVSGPAFSNPLSFSLCLHRSIGFCNPLSFFLCLHRSTGFSNPLSFSPCLPRSTGFSEVIVVVGGCERVGGFNLPYTECYDPVTGEWKSLAKLPEFTKSEYAVCALRNDILVSGKSCHTDVAWRR